MNNKKYIEGMKSVLVLLDSGATIAKIKEATPYASQIIDELKAQRVLISTGDGLIVNGDLSALALQCQAELDRLNQEEKDRNLQREATEVTIKTSQEAVKQSRRANAIAVAALIIALASFLWQVSRQIG